MEKERVSTVGIDLSKRTLEAVRLRGTKKERFSGETNQAGLILLEKWLRKEDFVVLEAGGQAFRIARLIMQSVGCECAVLNPGDVATIYQSLKKTDKEDALKLARLAHRHPREELPEVPIPSEEEQAIRRLSSEQAYWSERIRNGKNRLHSVYLEAGLPQILKKDLSSHTNRQVSFEKLPPAHRPEAERLMREISYDEETLCEVEETIKQKLRENAAYTQLVMSMPGIGPILALALLGHFGDCKRFSSAKQAAYFVGLVPRVEISGQMIHYGHIVKSGCTAIRRVIIQGAWALSRSSEGGDLRAFYERLHPRKGKKRAIVALARKMTEVLYTMISTGELYRYSTAATLHRKLIHYGIAAAA